MAGERGWKAGPVLPGDTAPGKPLASHRQLLHLQKPGCLQRLELSLLHTCHSPVGVGLL